MSRFKVFESTKLMKVSVLLALLSFFLVIVIFFILNNFVIFLSGDSYSSTDNLSKAYIIGEQIQFSIISQFDRVFNNSYLVTAQLPDSGITFEQPYNKFLTPFYGRFSIDEGINISDTTVNEVLSDFNISGLIMGNKKLISKSDTAHLTLIRTNDIDDVVVFQGILLNKLGFKSNISKVIEQSLDKSVLKIALFDEKIADNNIHMFSGKDLYSPRFLVKAISSGKTLYTSKDIKEEKYVSYISTIVPYLDDTNIDVYTNFNFENNLASTLREAKVVVIATTLIFLISILIIVKHKQTA